MSACLGARFGQTLGVRAKSMLTMLALCGGLTSSCGGDDAKTDPKDAGPDGPVTLDVYPGDFVEEDLPMKMLADGDEVKLVSAPQGGHVVHIGARVRGLKTDVVNIRARIRDPQTNAIQVEEARDIVMKPVAGEPDLMEPDPRSVSQVTHIPTCPNYDAYDLVDQSWTLEVLIDEVAGPGVGSATLGIKLTCQQADASSKAQCHCECEANYVLGKCSGTGPTDAGSD